MDAIITGVSPQHPDEDWSERDLEMLLQLAFKNVDESRRCYNAGCSLAALVMLAAGLEAALLGMVIAQEGTLRADGAWPPRPSRIHLSELTQLAATHGWLKGETVVSVTEVLNKARTMAAHPGAYVRGMRSAPPDLDLSDDAGYVACFEIVTKAAEQLQHSKAPPTSDDN